MVVIDMSVILASPLDEPEADFFTRSSVERNPNRLADPRRNPW
jgi:hypothetical protein